MLAPFAELAHELERRIRARTGRRIRDLTIELLPEFIILRGQTDSFYLKQLAQHSVREILPQVRLINAILVGRPETSAIREESVATAPAPTGVG